MQISIARVEDIHATQAVFSRERFDSGQYLRKVLARNRSVHTVIIRRNAPCRRERGLAPRPESEAFGLVAGCSDLDRPTLLHDLVNALDFLRYFLRRAVGFA